MSEGGDIPSSDCCPETTVTKTGRKDDEALSSLLLLLKSRNKPETRDVDTPCHSELSTDYHPDTDHVTTLARTNSRVDIDLQSLRQYFHLPLSQAARSLGTCSTSLKKVCRKNGIERWPCRQIRSLTKTLTTLQRACLNINLPPNLRCQYGEEIAVLEKSLLDVTEVLSLILNCHILSLVQNPNVDLSHVNVKKRSRKGDDICDDSDSDLDESDDLETRPSSPVMLGYCDSQGTLLPNPLEAHGGDTADGNTLPSRQDSDDTISGSDDLIVDDIDGNGNEENKRRRLNTRNCRREETTYDHQTGWIAGCSKCGKLGKYRSPAEGRPFQHSTGVGRYCGYYRLNPRRGFTQGTRTRKPSQGEYGYESGIIQGQHFSAGCYDGPLSSLDSSAFDSQSVEASMLMAPRPQLATIHSIGINGSGGMVPPMLVHDGMADPIPHPLQRAPFLQHMPTSMSITSSILPTGASIGVMQGFGLSAGNRMNEFSMQQYANAVLGHPPNSAPQPLPHAYYQHQLLHPNMQPYRPISASVYPHASTSHLNKCSESTNSVAYPRAIHSNESVPHTGEHSSLPTTVVQSLESGASLTVSENDCGGVTSPVTQVIVDSSATSSVNIDDEFILAESGERSDF